MGGICFWQKYESSSWGTFIVRDFHSQLVGGRSHIAPQRNYEPSTFINARGPQWEALLTISPVACACSCRINFPIGNRTRGSVHSCIACEQFHPVSKVTVPVLIVSSAPSYAHVPSATRAMATAVEARYTPEFVVTPPLASLESMQK